MGEQIYKVRDPSGNIREIKGPEGASDAEIIRQAQLLFSAQSAPVDPSQGELPLAPFGLNTGISMPQGISRFSAGAGKAFSDIGTGAQQLAGVGPSPQEIDEQQRLDAPLMKTGAGISGNIAGTVAATVPTMAIPGVNTFKGAALLGGALGALQPVGSKESRPANVAIGAGAGLGGQTLGSMLGKFARPVQSTLNPEQRRLAQVALDEGIPLGAAELTGSKPLKLANSVFGNLPLTARTEAERVGSQLEAFNKAALSKAGIEGSLATPDVLQNQKKALGTVFEDISGRNKIRLFTPSEIPQSQVHDWQQISVAKRAERGVAGELDDIARDAQKKLDPDAAARISTVVDKILSDTDKNGYMLGTNYQAWREPLRLEAKAGNAEATFMGRLRKTLDNAFRNQLPPEDIAAWEEASRKYANLKTVTGAMTGNTPGTVAGNISPAQLGMSLSQSIGKESKALGRGELNDLARAGNAFLREPPDSFTAQRALYQSLLTGGGGAGIGATTAGVTGNDPLAGAAYGAGVVGAGLLAPRLAQALMNNPGAQQYVVHQANSPTAKALADLLKTSGRSLGVGSAAALLGGQ